MNSTESADCLPDKGEYSLKYFSLNLTSTVDPTEDESLLFLYLKNCSENSYKPNSTEQLSGPLFVLEAMALGLFILLTIGGNLLVILAVVPSPTLRLPTHSLIVNLAVADLLLGVTVLPLSAARELSGVWLMGPGLCSAWTALDVLCCTASILSLCGISVDRYVGVSRPLSYTRILTKRRVRCLIAGIWSLALAISMAQPLGWHEEPDPSGVTECHVNKELGYVIFSACGSFYIPAMVILALYALVYRAAVRHSHFLYSGTRVTRSDVTLRVHLGNSRTGSSLKANIYGGHSSDKGGCPYGSLPFTGSSSVNGVLNQRRSSDTWSVTCDQGRRLTVAGLYGRAAKFRRQKKAAKTLGIVVGGFLLCWFPFFIILPIDAACSSCDLSGAPFNFAFWLGYFNSCINPFIYACSSRELRRAFRGILCWRRRSSNCQRYSGASALTIRTREQSDSSAISVAARPTD